jgi:hypothetical protein
LLLQYLGQLLELRHALFLLSRWEGDKGLHERADDVAGRRKEEDSFEQPAVVVGALLKRALEEISAQID